MKWFPHGMQASQVTALSNMPQYQPLIVFPETVPTWNSACSLTKEWVNKHWNIHKAYEADKTQ